MRLPVAEVKGESSVLQHLSYFAFSYMLNSSMIFDRANLWVKCEIQSLFAVDVCHENLGQRVQNILEYNPIVLLFYKLLSKKKVLPVKSNAVSPVHSNREVQQAILVIHVS